MLLVMTMKWVSWFSILAFYLGLKSANFLFDFFVSDPFLLTCHVFNAALRCSRMTVTPKISINDGNLVVHGKTILTGVPDNIVLTPGSGVGLVTGAFIGATASQSKSVHVFPVGVLE